MTALFRSLLLPLILLTGACSAQPAGIVQYRETAAPLADIEFTDGTHLTAEIAATPADRQKGLMHRDFLAKDRGMIFIFTHAQPLAFWMKNTRIPLDMRFYDAAGRLIAHYPKAEPCRQDPCPAYPAPEPGQFVLETAASALPPPQDIIRITLPAGTVIQ